MKLVDDQQLDKEVYLWFMQKRMEGVPISGPIRFQKAVELSRSLHGNGSEGRFCKRHGIRNLTVQGEKLSADNEAVDSYVSSFSKFVEEKKLS